MSKGFWNSFTYACLKFCLSQSHFVLWDYSQMKLTKSTRRQLYEYNKICRFCLELSFLFVKTCNDSQMYLINNVTKTMLLIYIMLITTLLRSAKIFYVMWSANDKISLTWFLAQPRELFSLRMELLIRRKFEIMLDTLDIVAFVWNTNVHEMYFTKAQLTKGVILSLPNWNKELSLYVKLDKKSYSLSLLN